MEALVAALRAGRPASGGHLEPPRTSVPPEGPEQSWVTQCQDLLKEMDSAFSDGGEPPQAELADNPKAFLASFEQVAEACRWPREEWAARLLPALSGEAKEAFNGLETGDQEDYGKVKAAILRGAALKMEAQRQHFRQFRYQEIEDPRRVYSRLRELCHQWLKPERRTKEQILELLVLEQFLAVLPAEVKARVAARDLGGIRRVALTEEFLRSYHEATAGEKQMPSHAAATEVAEAPPDISWRENPPEAVGKDEGNPILITIDERTSPSGVEFFLPEGEEGSVAEFPEVERTTLIRAKTTTYWEVKEGNDQLPNAIAAIASTQELHEEKEMLFIQSSEVKEAFPVTCPGNEMMKSPAWSRKKSLGTKRERQRKWPQLSQINVFVRDRVQNRECVPPALKMVGTPPPHKKATSPAKPPDVSSSSPGRWHHFKSHISTDQTVSPGVALNECQECGKIFQYKFHLLRHQKIHTGEKPFPCLQCGRAFGRKDKLIEHQCIHTGKKPFPCYECGKVFSIGSSLLKHHRTWHSEVRLNECSECGKSFALSSMLRKHQKIHWRKELHECPTCGKSFHWRSAMKRHQKIHGRLLQCLGSPSGQERPSTNFKGSIQKDAADAPRVWKT